MDDVKDSVRVAGLTLHSALTSLSVRLATPGTTGDDKAVEQVRKGAVIMIIIVITSDGCDWLGASGDEGAVVQARGGVMGVEVVVVE